MQSLIIEPEHLSGRIMAQPSKSMAHRMILCALLAKGVSHIDNVVLSDDIRATIDACEAFGAKIVINVSDVYADRKKITVLSSGQIKITDPVIDCHESGSTARFIIPVSRLCGEPVTVTGGGRLVERPFEIYKDLLPEKGITYGDENGKMPITLSGKLSPGEYAVRGDVSSQFISGLLFALPCLEGDSVIRITGKLESRSYIEMTLAALKSFGVEVMHDDDFNAFTVKGGQSYKPQDLTVEGDWSQAAFFCVLGAICGNLAIEGLKIDSLQGDKVIVDIIRRMGANVTYGNDTLNIGHSDLHAVNVDASQCPDLVPAIAVAAALCEGRSVIGNAARLRIKESDRLHAVCVELNKLAACVEEMPDGLVIHGVRNFRGAPVDGWNDHRIVMALAIASSACEGQIEINGYSAVSKSYPEFWDDIKKLGGKIDGQHLG